MAKRYEETGRARFVVEFVGGVEQVRIKARRNWFALSFLVLWLTGWTVGGVAAIYMVMSQFEPFLLVWLCGWALGWVFAAVSIAWQLTGAETLRVVGGDLEIAYSLAGLDRRRLFRGSEIRRLTAATADLFSRMQPTYPPFLTWVKSGSVQFDYGARTIRAAAGLDEAEGRMIVEHLRRRLPAAAVAE